jgi:type III pantothenate kinase
MTIKRWLLDLGNTRLKMAPLHKGARGELTALPHGDDDFEVALRAHFDAHDGDEAWLASVAPPDTTSHLRALMQDLGIEVQRVHSRAAMGRLKVAYAEPARLGVDRFLALLAASERDDGPWLLASAGSALTLDLLGKDGVHVGGLIAPMPAQMRSALATRFAQLDLPEGKAQDFACDTADAIASGARAAALGVLEHGWNRAREKLGCEPAVLVSGGSVDLLLQADVPGMQAMPSLVLDGLARYVKEATA